MDLYLTEDANDAVAILEARKAIFALMSETNGSLVTGVESVEYLGPDLTDTSAAQGDSSKNVNYESDQSLDSGFAVLVAVGSFFVFVAMFAAYRYKRSDDNKDGPSTIAAGSHITGASSTMSGSSGPISPFSAMLPDAYQLNEPNTMSAILEDNSDSASHSQSRSSDIMISDCGYTTEEDSHDQSYLQSFTNDDPILGAQKMDSCESEEDYLFDTGDISFDLPAVSVPSPVELSAVSEEDSSPQNEELGKEFTA
jgi:hypothetical protein